MESEVKKENLVIKVDEIQDFVFVGRECRLCCGVAEEQSDLCYGFFVIVNML